jgi:hypothetical protein
MDEAFPMRAGRLLKQRVASPLGHEQLLATVTKQQRATPTARAQAQLPPALDPEQQAPLTTLLLGSLGWRDAGRRLSGCFSRPAPERRINVR